MLANLLLPGIVLHLPFSGSHGGRYRSRPPVCPLAQGQLLAWGWLFTPATCPRALGLPCRKRRRAAVAAAGGRGGLGLQGLVMEQVKVQIAVANAQELLQRMTDKCFRKCIGKPGSSLDNSEQKCIAMCMDRYMDAWNTVSRAYNSRLQRERANM
uniref:Translocase of inner mitochondrial membrane 13 n=1 Tax=Crocodylus porosus TaxID=8502 RepID=A0A7M4F3N5_CROPO